MGTFWPDWATGCYLFGMLLVGIGFAIYCFDLLAAITRAYGSLLNGLGLDTLFSRLRRADGKVAPPTVLAASMVAIDGGIASMAGMVLSVALLARWALPSFPIDPLWAKNLTYFFGHTTANLTMYVAADVVFLLPLGPIEPPLALHHLEHGLLLVAGRALATRLRPAKAALAEGGSPWQLVAALLLSLLSLVGMAPDLYGYVDGRPLAHASLHVGFAALGHLSTAAAQRYARALGPLWLGAFAVMTIVASTGFGAPPPI